MARIKAFEEGNFGCIYLDLSYDSLGKIRYVGFFTLQLKGMK